jgi:hypothetical protein
MKGNINSLMELAQIIEHQETVKQDYLVNTVALEMKQDNQLVFQDKEYQINDIAHQQIADRLKIPKRYYDKMSTISGLRTHNVNAWFLNNPEKRLVRTLEGKARAFLSDRFRPIDNFFILSSFLPVLAEQQNLKVQSQTLTDKKMYLQLTFPSLQKEILKGDVVQAGIILTNSEVGHGAVDVKSFLWRLVCSNGMIGKSLLHKYHVGRKIGNDIEDYNIFKNDTIEAELKSFQLRLRDIIAHALSETGFEKTINKIRKTTKDKILNPVKTVENVTKTYSFNENEKNKMFVNLTNSGDMNRWNLANSITALAHDIENPDRQYEVEKIGNEIIELKPAQWEVLTA